MIATHMLIEHDTRPAQVIYVGEDTPVQFMAEPGDTIIVIMNRADQTNIDDCLDMGGEPIFNPYTGILECDDVDF